MEKADRKTRIAIVTSILQSNPGKSHSLNLFCEMFGAAKSTMSEDIAILRTTLQKYDQGDIEVILGAGGGVKYIPAFSPTKREDILSGIAQTLSDPSRILPGGYIYTVDVFSNPTHVSNMANILASLFSKANPDFIATVETKGIPLALGVARAMNKPLVITRREAKITEGSVVTINYLTGSSRRIQTMSISKRAVRAGQRALIIDDFISGGGSVHALFELMKELTITVAGCGVAIAMREPLVKKVDNYKSLLTLEQVDLENKKIIIHPV
ncbi:MAG: pur operon repressor [Clostridia bacterium]|jgi:purine operon repressor|nr:pur operon repressor [Clostridia bacterium]